MNTLDDMLHKWCEKLMIDPKWPDSIPLEEKLDHYIFPQIQQVLSEIENDREYYQTRFYMMRWAFRRLFKTYGEIMKTLEQENIRFLSEDLMKAIEQEQES